MTLRRRRPSRPQCAVAEDIERRMHQGAVGLACPPSPLSDRYGWADLNVRAGLSADTMTTSCPTGAGCRGAAVPILVREVPIISGRGMDLPGSSTSRSPLFDPKPSGRMSRGDRCPVPVGFAIEHEFDQRCVVPGDFGPDCR